MLFVILAAILLAVSLGVFVVGHKARKAALAANSHASVVPAGLINVAGSVAFLFAAFMLAGTSYVFVDADETAHLKKVYGTSSLMEGRIIATEGEKGFQADIIPPGFHFIPLITVINDVEDLPVVEIPAGYYGRITTKDGRSLLPGDVLAQPWPTELEEEMLDAKFFLENGGQKGPQTSVLTPGKYRLNLYLYNVQYGDGSRVATFNADGFFVEEGRLDTRVTNVPPGHVAVIKSNISEAGLTCGQTVRRASEEPGALSAPLVPNGCKGIWETALLPGSYFLNKDAYEVTVVDTRAQAWRYEGGYEKRSINLTVDQKGNITQDLDTEVVSIPEDAADAAIDVKVEGWTVRQNLRTVVQIRPENAPIVVATTGGLQQVEDRILTPSIQSIVRSKLGGDHKVIPTGALDANEQPILRSVQILDVVEKRELLETAVEEAIIVEGRKAGIDITEVRFGNPDMPPELLSARKREQLAQQLRRSYAQERSAQEERIKTEEAKALADQQPRLVQQQIEVQRSELYEEERLNRGRADRSYLEQIAAGQAAQAEVLGKDRVLMLKVVEMGLDTLANNPELGTYITKLVPDTIVTGTGGLEGPMAVLGRALKGSDTPETSTAIPEKQ